MQGLADLPVACWCTIYFRPREPEDAAARKGDQATVSGCVRDEDPSSVLAKVWMGSKPSNWGWPR